MGSRERRPWLVLSDVHLGVVPDATERQVGAFLRYAAAGAAGLLINGDLFDVFLATRHFVSRRHVRTLAALADVVDAGVRVLFVGGNHDAHEYGGAMLRDDLGVELLAEPAYVQLGPFRAVVVHGDGVRAGQHEYRKRHPVLRSPTFRWAVERVLHLDRIHERVAAFSGTPAILARLAHVPDGGPKPAAPLIESWARGVLDCDPHVDLVLAGHSHLPAWVEVHPGRYYVNSGDWLSHMTYVVLPADGHAPEVRRWPEHDLVLPSPVPATARN